MRFTYGQQQLQAPAVRVFMIMLRPSVPVPVPYGSCVLAGDTAAVLVSCHTGVSPSPNHAVCAVTAIADFFRHVSPPEFNQVPEEAFETPPQKKRKPKHLLERKEKRENPNR